MNFKYKINVIAALKDAGYSTYRLRTEKLLAESTLQKFRNGEMVSWENFSTVCRLLNRQPGDIIGYFPEWVETRIIELTELEEEKLTDYYRDRWKNDDSEQVQLDEDFFERFGKWLEEESEKEETDTDFLHVLESIARKYTISDLSKDKAWTEIEEQYPEYEYQLHEVFDSDIEEFNEAIEEAEKEFVQGNVKRELEERKLDIQNEALKEYLDSSEE